MNKTEKVVTFLNENNGYITTHDFVKLGISKNYIPNFIKERIVRKVSFGLYIANDLIEDEYFIFQKKHPNVIFSYKTGLQLLKVTNQISKINITIKRKEKVRGNYQVHYITDKLYDLGKIEILSPYQNPIRVYNAERCICDILKEKNELDDETKNILIQYFKYREKNIPLLLEYAEIFHIKDKVKTIIEIMNI